MPKFSNAQKQKIIEGRLSVDAYRTAHTKLHSKLWHKGIPEEHTPLLNIMLGAFKRLGFNTIQEFFAASEELNIQTMRECWQPVGECDGCARFGEQIYCVSNCYAEKSRNKIIPFETFRVDYNGWRYYLERIGDMPCQASGGKGFSLVKVKEPDVDWRWQ